MTSAEPGSGQRRCRDVIAEADTVTHVRGPFVVAVLKQQLRCRDL
jgi:hypothetical protein